MKFLRQYTATPNRLIDDTTMHYTSKIVYHALAFMQQRSGLIRVTVGKLASLAGLCEDTVLQGLNELVACGFVKRKRNWRWSQKYNHPIYSTNTYKLNQNYTGGYTLISSKIMGVQTTPAGFCVLLFLYRCAGRTGRAFPSLRYIAGAWRDKTGTGLEMSKSTVLRVLKQLSACQAFLKVPCRTGEGDLSCNSYYLTDMVPAKVQGGSDAPQLSFKHFFESRGGSIFPDAYFSNKITMGFTARKGEKGAGQFGNSHNLETEWVQEPLFHFDGTGVKVSTCGEHDFTA